jgi:hypothetical protein
LGDAGFYYFHEFRFELIYLKLLRKWIKRGVRLVKKDSPKRQVWLNFHVNFPLVKKPKNARMGKGKGGFFRWAVRLAPTLMFMEFQGFPQLALRRVLHKCHYAHTTPPTLLTNQASAPAWGATFAKAWVITLDTARLWM